MHDCETMPGGAGAGILPYTRVNGALLVLVGQEFGTGYWSDFGGKRESVDGTDLRATAAREFAEETRGVFNDGVVAGGSPSRDTLASSTAFMLRILRAEAGVVRVDLAGYALFLAPVPYVDERVFAVVSGDDEDAEDGDAGADHHLSRPSSGGEGQRSPCREKRDFAWVPADKLASSVETETGEIHHRQRRHMILAYRLSHALLTIDCAATFAALLSQSEHVFAQLLVSTTTAAAAAATATAIPSPTAEAEAVAPSPAAVTLVTATTVASETTTTTTAALFVDLEVTSDGELPHHTTLALPAPLQESCGSLFVSFADWCQAQQQRQQQSSTRGAEDDSRTLLTPVTDMHRRKRRSGVIEYCPGRAGNHTSQRRRTTHAWRRMIEQFQQQLAAGQSVEDLGAGMMAEGEEDA